MPMGTTQNNRKGLTPKQRRLRRMWRTVRQPVVLLVSVVIVYFAARFTVNYVLSNYINPVDVNDATPIEVVIPKSSSASTIAQILYNARGEDEEGLIPTSSITSCPW